MENADPIEESADPIATRSVFETSRTIPPMRIAFTVVVSVCLAGCVSTTPNDASPVQITKNAADVAQCTPIGTVSGYDPMWGAAGTIGGVSRMQKQVIGLRGNRLLVTSIMSATGIAYRCEP